ncbi:uncharacterized protein KQ657_002700 [Scheffersomyces spartinae]|uniref:Uncharacterized protein n=1 Tax=Scheffersomyces spartinae TaxID=45513 RepID=A0A9P7V695_9ASCO|nr:uncharacterized protein KQ657_002700 [Scheffersomyces spartinae]KAG7191911.1 hypothetical protein KQ657_002700 [Scheffersomyces spartinae]
MWLQRLRKYEHEDNMIMLLRQMQMAMQEQRNILADQAIILRQILLQLCDMKQGSGSKHKFTSEKSPIPVVEEVMTSDSATGFAEGNTKGAIDPIGKLSGQEIFDQLNYNEKKEALLLARPIIDQSLILFESFPLYLSVYSIKKRYTKYFEDFEATNNGFSLLLRSDEMKFDYNKISNTKINRLSYPIKMYYYILLVDHFRELLVVKFRVPNRESANFKVLLNDMLLTPNLNEIMTEVLEVFERTSFNNGKLKPQEEIDRYLISEHLKLTSITHERMFLFVKHNANLTYRYREAKGVNEAKCAIKYATALYKIGIKNPKLIEALDEINEKVIPDTISISIDDHELVRSNEEFRAFFSS